jgi:L-glyceraldehyde 3-phosphate reductase
MQRIRALAKIAANRGQTLAQLALAWVLARPAVTSVLIGASSLKQIQENVVTLEKTHITLEELAAIDAACSL